MSLNRIASLGLLALFISLACLGSSTATAAGLKEALQGLGAKSRRTILRSIKVLGALGDPAALPALEALRDRKLRVDEQGRVLILDGGGAFARDVVTGERVAVGTGRLRSPVINNRVRRVLLPVIARLQLSSSSLGVRLAAARELAKRPRPDAAGAIRAALEAERDADVRQALLLALAQIEIDSRDPRRRLSAVRTLGASADANVRERLRRMLQTNEAGEFTMEPNPEVRAAAADAIRTIERRLALVSLSRNLFYGVSLGSVLLLAALGLAITFGLMGVINMAHGEMLMLGAYATFVTQNLFRTYLPGWFDWYLVAAVPMAFGVAAVTGMVLERCVLRHLYGRPLETLLATWGISLLLIQTVRLVFGAQNVEVASPTWMSGGTEVMQGLVLTHNRVAIVLFVLFAVALVWVLLRRTPLGLRVRAVTQNRSMAACMGVPVSRVDMWTFGLGSGIAGLGGVALSQIGNVGPELGQSYIVDSFMVVVLGGVGKIAGTVWGALCLGVVNKFLEPYTGAVLGKILVLAFIILFIQKRPQGMFALKGRTAEG
ncbi:urea ABC transporter permease subunit UrtB [Deferrisoma camini]|uniref:urea ABC transporter permease subunit UrtB n=1 Tax=Deferrisoma camini TaxID=1035120 RepID=UPI0004A3DFCA|nr:urea ABC transporter permease subunit UrtB [Deferrisoma camini]